MKKNNKKIEKINLDSNEWVIRKIINSVVKRQGRQPKLTSRCSSN